MRIFREIEFGTPDYEQERRLRDWILRRPLGRELSEADCAGEVDQRHFGLFEGNDLVACVIAVFQPDGSTRLRQMAVAETHQRSGCGREMLARVEQELRETRTGKLVLNARCAAMGFYEKSGYAIVGDEFTEIGLPHRRMEKVLCENPTQPAARP